MIFYAGIGSRQTPPEVLSLMTQIAQGLANFGYTLRSGGADGADTAFERGAGDAAEIYLPWTYFNGRREGVFVHATPEAEALARRIHPSWGRLSLGARKLHIRNCYQVLGADLKTPSAFVVCWTPNGSGSGGTGQAIRLAREKGIPVYDIGSQDFSHVKLMQAALAATI